MRKRRTKAEKEQTLNHILKRKVEGKSDLSIREELQLDQRNYNKYNELLKDKFTNEMLAQREEHFAESIRITQEGVNEALQVLEEQMHNEKASPTARTIAAEKNINARFMMLRMMYEAGQWAQGLKQNFKQIQEPKILVNQAT